MELSTRNQVSLALFTSLTLCAVFQNMPTLFAFLMSALLFALVAYLDRRDVRINDDTKRQIRELKERLDNFQLAHGMRR